MLVHIRVSTQGFLALKLWVSGIWLMTWNIWFLVLKHVGLPGSKVQGELMLSGMFLSSSFLAFSIVLIPKLRRSLISKKRAHLYQHSTFVFLGLLTFLMGLAVLVRAFLMFTGRLPIPESIIR